MADILQIFLLIVGGMLIFQSHWLVSCALFPKAVERSRDLYGRPIKLTLLGLITTVPIVLLGVFVVKSGGDNPLTQLIGSVCLGVPAYLALFGSSGLALRIGEGLSSSDGEASWRKTMKGGAVLTLTYLLPFAGWIFLTGWTLVTGVGAGLTILFKKEPKGAPEESEKPTKMS